MGAATECDLERVTTTPSLEHRTQDCTVPSKIILILSDLFVYIGVVWTLSSDTP